VSGTGGVDVPGVRCGIVRHETSSTFATTASGNRAVSRSPARMASVSPASTTSRILVAR